MASRRCALALAAALAGCGDDGIQPVPAPRCEGVFASGSALIMLAPAAFHRLPIGLGIPADTDVLVRRLPEGFRASVTRSLADGQIFLEVRVPGSASGEVVLELETRCGGTATPLTLRALVRPPSWRRGPAWGDGARPSARRGAQLFTGPGLDGTIVGFLYGGTDESGPLADLYGLQADAAGWWIGAATGEPPGPREGVRIASGVTGVAVLHGGIAAAPDGGGKVALPGTFGIHVQHGGAAVHFSRWDVAGEPQEDAPPGDFEPALALDGERAISACGWNEAWGTHCRARTFDVAEGAWRELETEGPAPEGRFGALFALDEGRLVIFGGDRAEPGSPPDVADDAWALHFDASPPRWVKLGEAPGLGRRDAAFALDAWHDRLLVWGGTRDGKEPFPGLFALAFDRFSEGLVEEIAVEGAAPEPRFGAAAAAWTAPGEEGAPRFVFGFGDTGSELLADLWFLDPPGDLLPGGP